MPDDFDPYYTWLGISRKDQPPNHYRLLGIELFEANPNVIDHAADRQTGHLRTFQAGARAKICQHLLNEVAAARVCLLNPKHKAAYDQRLRDAGSIPLEASEPQSLAAPLSTNLLKALSQASQSRPTTASARPLQTRIAGGGFTFRPWMALAPVAVVLFGVTIWLVTRGGGQEDNSVAAVAEKQPPSCNTVGSSTTGPDSTTDSDPDAISARAVGRGEYAGADPSARTSPNSAAGPNFPATREGNRLGIRLAGRRTARDFPHG